MNKYQYLVILHLHGDKVLYLLYKVGEELDGDETFADDYTDHPLPMPDLDSAANQISDKFLESLRAGFSIG